mmetsp:Transcript_109397/g.337737  ORF Transcript_109397/g.337737 Transcript_109397/m.337737 type:complete len:242 (-) Transcript_109397:760-1485(-)
MGSKAFVTALYSLGWSRDLDRRWFLGCSRDVDRDSFLNMSADAEALAIVFALDRLRVILCLSFCFMGSTRALWMWAMAAKTNFRRSTTSLTVAVLEPRSLRITSMNSSNARPSLSASASSSSKMKSAQSKIPSGSTPTSASARMAAGFSRIFLNSTREILRSPSSSRVSTMVWSFEVTNSTIWTSFSVAVMVLTISQSTPMSMFISVSAERRMNTKKSAKQTMLSLLMSMATVARLSRKVP